ncbi:MucR family transcriptional regulator [Methylorubrum rhodesianum]|uniref:MucR family transcriptional regulator n=1 Tax=Methylorubrum rhodesianum TaxID=29427 RepID=UPI003D2E8491
MTAADRETVAIGTAATAALITVVATWRGTPAEALPTLYTQMQAAISASILGAPSQAASTPAAVTNKPINGRASAEQIEASITPDALISFVDGKPYKTLKRHLGTHGLDPASYCRRYGLPRYYPMVAASYSKQRSALAKGMGLGQPKGRTRAAA